MVSLQYASNLYSIFKSHQLRSLNRTNCGYRCFHTLRGAATPLAQAIFLGYSQGYSAFALSTSQRALALCLLLRAAVCVVRVLSLGFGWVLDMMGKYGWLVGVLFRRVGFSNFIYFFPKNQAVREYFFAHKRKRNNYVNARRAPRTPKINNKYYSRTAQRLLK